MRCAARVKPHRVGPPAESGYVCLVRKPPTRTGESSIKKVLLFSLLLIAGMAGSQMLGAFGGAEHAVREVVTVVTMLLPSFIMIHVGYEFEIDRTRLGSCAVNYGVASSAAAFPWLLCSLYFVTVRMPAGSWTTYDGWSQALLAGCFAAPTSAGALCACSAPRSRGRG